nr:hypothetical protein [Tanacetum cinerariifolium]
MTRSSTKDLLTPFEEPKRVLRSARKLFKTTSLNYSSSLEFNLFSDLKDQFEEEVTDAMREPIMEEYMTKTREDYGSGIARHKIDEKAHFNLKGQFLKELRDNTFSGSDNENANKHIKKVLETADLFHIPDVNQDQIMLRVFPMSLTGATSRWLRNEPAGVIPSMKVADAKKAIQDMADHSQKWHNETSTRARSTKTFDELASIQNQLINLVREIKKVNEKVYSAQVGCDSYGGPYYTKDCPLKEEGKTLEEAYTLSLECHSHKEEDIEQLLRDSTNGTMEIIQKMVLVELMGRKEFATNLKRLLKENPRIGNQIRASTNMHDATILEDSLPPKKKDPKSFTIPCHINNICFEKALADLGASVSVMPYTTFTNLGIDKFVFLVDFIVLDLPKDIKVLLILERPFLSTTHAKINVFKRKITLKVGDDKIVFKSDNPTSNIIRRFYALGLRERMELDLEVRLIREALIENRLLDLAYGDYIKLNDLNEPLELRRNQVEYLGVMIEEG